MADPIRRLSAHPLRDEEAHAGRVFAFTLAGAFLVLGFFARHRLRHNTATVSYALASILFLVGALVPTRLGPLRRGWMKVGETIGLVTTPLFLGILYYLIVSPIAFSRRVRHGSRSQRRSGWLQRDPPPPPSRMERQF